MKEVPSVLRRQEEIRSRCLTCNRSYCLLDETERTDGDAVKQEITPTLLLEIFEGLETCDDRFRVLFATYLASPTYVK